MTLPIFLICRPSYYHLFSNVKETFGCEVNWNHSITFHKNKNKKFKDNKWIKIQCRVMIACFLKEYSIFKKWLSNLLCFLLSMSSNISVVYTSCLWYSQHRPVEPDIWLKSFLHLSGNCPAFTAREQDGKLHSSWAQFFVFNEIFSPENKASHATSITIVIKVPLGKNGLVFFL